MLSIRLFAFLFGPFIVHSMVDGCCPPTPPPPPPGPPTAPPASPCSRTANFEELGDFFEGDMIRLEDLSKNHLNNAAVRWPNGVVPYVIEGSFSTSEQSYLDQALATFNTRTGGCVRWIPRTSETNYVAITSALTGCWSYVGLVSIGRQELNLQPGNPGCLNIGSGTAEHEMLHALGTFHEQSRPDRDQYVRINFENIQSGKEGNFEAKSPSAVLLNGDYEYGSVMHYSRCSFTSNNIETITPIDPSATIGQRGSMTQLDVNKLMAYYQC